ncbi:TonB family protein [bacterium]|nr:TonB family protein [bacterium]
MMSTLVTDGRPAYGAVVLAQKAHRYTSWALVVAAAVHMAVLGVYWLSVYMKEEEPPVHTIRIMKYSELGPPPSISGLNEAIAPSVSVASPAAKPQIGIPVPVPDAEISPEQTLMTQQEMSSVGDTTGVGSGASATIEADVKVENIQDEDGPPAAFVPVEIMPKFVKQVKPEYPEIARKTGMKATVWVKLWITKEGKVKQVVVVKSDNDLFNQAAIDAAKECLFTPAVGAAGPVAIWVTFPYQFSLRGGR